MTAKINWKMYLPLFAICVVASFIGGWLAYNIFIVSEETATLFTAIATLVVAVATIFLVFITNRVVSATKDTIHGQILLQLSRDYASDDMLQAIRQLREWKQNYEKEFVRKFIEELNNDIHWDCDKYRRRVSHHFYQIYLLRESGVINDDFLSTLVKQGKIDFLLEVIKPLDLAIAKDLQLKKLDETKVKFLEKAFDFFEKTRSRLQIHG